MKARRDVAAVSSLSSAVLGKGVLDIIVAVAFVIIRGGHGGKKLMGRGL